VGPKPLDFAEFYASSRDDCLRTVLAITGDKEAAADFVAEAFAGPERPGGRWTGIRRFAVTVWAALFTGAATGRLTRWLPARPSLTPITAAIPGFGAAAVDVTAPRTLAPVPIAGAASASLIRLTRARRAARRCLTTRATLT